jgi:hypothetical protein
MTIPKTKFRKEGSGILFLVFALVVKNNHRNYFS